MAPVCKGCTRQAAVRHAAVGRLLSGAALLMIATCIARLGCASFIATQAWAEASQAAALVFLLRFGESRRIIFTEVILGIILGAAAGTLSALVSSCTVTVFTISVAMILIHQPCPSKLRSDVDFIVAHTAPTLGFWQLLLATFWFVYRSAAGSGAVSCLGMAFAHIVMLVSAVELVGVLSIPEGSVGGQGAPEGPTCNHLGASTTDPRATGFPALPLQQVPSTGTGAGVFSPAAMWKGGVSGSRPVGQAGRASAEGCGHSPSAWRGGGAFAQVRSPVDGPMAATRGGGGSGTAAVRRRRRSSLPPLLGEDGQELAHLLPPTGRAGGACGGRADGPITMRASCPVVPHSHGPGTLLRSSSAAAVGAAASGGWGGGSGGPSRVSSLPRSHSPGSWRPPRVRSSLPYLTVALGADAGMGTTADALPDGSSPDEPSSARRHERTFSLRNEGYPMEEEAEEAEGQGSPPCSADLEAAAAGQHAAVGDGAPDDGGSAARDGVSDGEGAGAAGPVQAKLPDALAGADERIGAERCMAIGGIDPWIASGAQPEPERFRYRRETGNSTHEYILLASTAPGTDGPPVYDSGFSSDDEGDGDRDDDGENDEDEDDEDEDNDEGDDSDVSLGEDEELEEGDGDGGVSDGCFSLVIDNAGPPLDNLAGANRTPQIITNTASPSPAAQIDADGTGAEAAAADGAAPEAAAGAAAAGDGSLPGVYGAPALRATAPAAAAARARPKRADPATVLLMKASRHRGGAPCHANDVRHDLAPQPGGTPPWPHVRKSHGSRHRPGCRGPPPDAPWDSSGIQAGAQHGGGATGGIRFQQANGAVPQPPLLLRRRHYHHNDYPYNDYPYDFPSPVVHFTQPPDLYGGGCDVADLADFDDLMSLGEVEAAAAATAEEAAVTSAATPDDFFSQPTDFWPSASAMTSLTRPTAAAAPSSTAVAGAGEQAAVSKRIRTGDIQLRVQSAQSCGAAAGGSGAWGAAPATWLPERSGVSALTGPQQGRQHQERKQSQQREPSCDDVEERPARLVESTLAQHMATMQSVDLQEQQQLMQPQEQPLQPAVDGLQGAEQLAAGPVGLAQAVSKGWDGAPAPHARALMECFLRDAAILTPLPGAEGYRTGNRPMPYDDLAAGCRDDAAGGRRWESDPAAVSAAAAAAAAPADAAAAERRSHPQPLPHPQRRAPSRTLQPVKSQLEAGDVRHSGHPGDHSRPRTQTRQHRSSAQAHVWAQGQMDLDFDLPEAPPEEADEGARLPLSPPLEAPRRRRRAPQPHDAAAVPAANGTAGLAASRSQGGDTAGARSREPRHQRQRQQQQQQQQPSERGTERARGRRHARKLSQGQLFAREVFAREHASQWDGDEYGFGYEHEYGYGYRDVLPPPGDYPAVTSTYEVYPYPLSRGDGGGRGGGASVGEEHVEPQPRPGMVPERERRRHSHQSRRHGVGAEAGIAPASPLLVDSPVRVPGEVVGVMGDGAEEPWLRSSPPLQEQHLQPVAYPGHVGERAVRSWQGPHSGGGGGAVPSPDGARMWSWLGQPELPASALAVTVTSGASPVGWPGPVGSNGGGGGIGGASYTAAAAAEWYNTVKSSGGGWGAPPNAALTAAAVTAVPTSPQQLRYAASPASPPAAQPPPAAAVGAAAVTSAPSTPPTNLVEPFSAAGQAVYRSLSGTRRYDERDHRRGISDNYKAALAAAAAAGNRSPPGTPGSTRPPESPPPPTPPAQPCSSAAVTPSASRHGECSGAPGTATASGGEGDGEVALLAAARPSKAGTSGGDASSAPKPDARRLCPEAQDMEVLASAPSLRIPKPGPGRDAPPAPCTTAATSEAEGECTVAVAAVDVGVMGDGEEGQGDGEALLAAVSGSTSRVTRLTLPSDGWWRQSNGGGAALGVAALASGAAAGGGARGGAVSPCTRCSWAAVSDLGDLGDDATDAGVYGGSARVLDVGSGVDSTGGKVYPGNGAAAAARSSMEAE